HPVIDEMRRFWNYADYFDPERELAALKNYYGLCSFLDDNVARVLAALQASSYADNTQVIYTSDHGDMIGNHGIWGKCYMYEDSVGIPLTLSGPGIAAGTNRTPVSLTDIAATIENAVGLPVARQDDEWRGRALHDFIDDPQTDRAVLSEYHDGGSPCGFYMLRTGVWKYVYFADENPPLLFDIDSDPRELHNLADDPAHADTLAGLRARLYRMVDPEATNRLAFADQAKMIEALGGMEAIRALPSFNHTPLEQA
ncbi:MAG: sulfatase-like hydrolase/transferase, partial [Gammaproteobacteria bacterium]|nr:sulfatase-like hydrolase/transferase [Gammaproteobacteria bacterium]